MGSFLRDIKTIHSSRENSAKRKSYGAVVACFISSFFLASGYLMLKLSHSIDREFTFLVGFSGTVLCAPLFCLRSTGTSPKPIQNQGNGNFYLENYSDDKQNTSEEFQETRTGGVDVVNVQSCTKSHLLDIILVMLLGIVFSGGHVHFAFVSIGYTSIGDARAVALAVHFIGNVLIESFLVKKTPRLFTVVAGFLGLIGTFIICQPKNLLALNIDVTHATGVGFAALSGISGSFYYCGLQKFKHLPVAMSHLSYFAGPLVYGLYGISTAENAPFEMCVKSLRAQSVIGSVIYAIGAILIVTGSQLSSASVSTSLKLLIILLGYLFQVMFLSQPLTVSSVVGAVLICACVILQSYVLLK